MAAAAHAFGAGPYERRLRVLLVTQQDPFYIPEFFSEFNRRYRCGGDEFVEIVGVTIQAPLGSRRAQDLARRIWSLYGTRGFIRMAGRYLAVKLRAVCRRRWQHSVRWYCEAAGIPMVDLAPERSIGRDGTPRGEPRANNVNGPTFHRLVERERVDLIISISASQIFGSHTLSAPAVGCINLHNAPLPKYRGMLPNFWQLYHGESESVLTIHTMVQELDGGEILAQVATPIEPDTTLESLMRESKRRSARALWEVLRAIHDGSAERRAMSDGEGSYFTWPTRREARELRRRGRRVW